MLTADEVADILRHEKVEHMLTDDELARRYGVCQSYMSKLLAGDCDPGDKILSKLGLQRIARYVEREAQ